MEIAPVPRRLVRRERRRLLLVLVVALPVVLLLLLPAVLGLERYVVMDDPAGSGPDEGTVVLAREVPPGDLGAGDVVAIGSDTGLRDGDRQARQIVAIDGDTAVISRGGVGGRSRLLLDDQSYSRVWLTVPWLGYPLALDGVWRGLGIAALGLAMLALLSRRAARLTRRVVTSAPRAEPTHSRRTEARTPG